MVKLLKSKFLGSSLRVLRAAHECENFGSFPFKTISEAVSPKETEVISPKTLKISDLCICCNNFVSEFLTFVTAVFEFETNNNKLKLYLDYKRV